MAGGIGRDGKGARLIPRAMAHPESMMCGSGAKRHARACLHIGGLKNEHLSQGKIRLSRRVCDAQGGIHGK
jgi:hypothetical protein